MFFKSPGKRKEYSDDWLMHQFKATGDLELLGRLYEKYMHLVYGVCLKYLKNREASQDATMQIFEKLIIEIPQRAIDNFKPWLYVLTKNYCLMQLRSEKSRKSGKEEMMEKDQVFMENSYEMHLNNDDVLEQNLDTLKRCIEQLKAEQKECIRMFYLEEKCYQEIADATKYQLKKVKSYIQNGKRNLKICMGQNV